MPAVREIAREINRFDPRLVWLYPSWLIDWVPSISCPHIVVVGPDSGSLHWERMARAGAWHSGWELTKIGYHFDSNRRLERVWSRTRAHVVMVGTEDLQTYRHVVGNDYRSAFVRYPHHDCASVRASMAEVERIRIILSGGGETPYVGDHLVRMVKALCSASVQLASNCEFRFIGRGYEHAATALRASGYVVTTAEWVDDYQAELAMCQVQCFPIAIGTGTKGKVVTALATGLLGIGSSVAFENIDVDLARDVLLYSSPEEIPSHLERVFENRRHYADVAKGAAVRVRRAHSPEGTARQFWEYARYVSSSSPAER